MIKLEKGKKPDYLSDDKVQELIERYKSNSDTVWNHEKIKERLLESSNSKCAYCECKLQIEDSYVEVEHFKCKKRYPDEVVNWDNLLPSCKRCNLRKGSLDVVITPIINPYEDDPKLHLSIQACRLYPKGNVGSKGDNTIKKLDLNDYERLLQSRFEASNRINKYIDDLVNNKSNIDYVRNNMITTLELCQPDKAFSAFLSFTLLNNKDTKIIKQVLIDNDLWDDDLNEMYTTCQKIALDPR